MSDGIMVFIVGVIALVAAIIFFVKRKRKPHEENEVDRHKEIREKLDRLLPEQFIVADIETTGLHPDKHEIIEIAAIKVNSKSIHHAIFNGLIKPKKRITKKITEITGISNEMLENDGEPLEKVVCEFLDFIGDLRLVFYNAPFDMSFLSRAARQVNRDIRNPVSDALDMARRAFPGMPSYKLPELAKAGGLNADGAHRALKDCEMALTVYTSCVTRLGRLQ